MILTDALTQAKSVEELNPIFSKPVAVALGWFYDSVTIDLFQNLLWLKKL